MISILVVDNGLAWGHGYRLQSDGADVLLYTPNKQVYPKWKVDVIGSGFLPKVKDIEEVIDSVDYIFFTDIGFGNMISNLRKKGYKVWGAGFSETLETNRLFSKQVMDELGILYPNTHIIYGISNLMSFLRDRLEKGEKYYVKPEYYRGDFESFLASDYNTVETNLSYLSNELGPYKDIFEFVVEENKEGVMIGIDTWMTAQGEFVRPYFIAFERHMDAIGKFCYTSVFDEVLYKLEDYFAKLGYIGNFSLEAIWDGKNLWVIDYCCRCPMTMGYIFAGAFDNYLKFVKQVYKGEVDVSSYVDIDKYYGCINKTSEYAKTKWCEVKVDSDSNVFFTAASRLDGRIFAVPVSYFLACVVASGNSWEETYDNLESESRKVNLIDGGISNTFPDLEEAFNTYRKITKNKEFII